MSLVSVPVKEPAAPAAPVGPAAPAAPVVPAAPAAPVGPAAPAAPVGPVAPSTPAVPVGPVPPPITASDGIESFGILLGFQDKSPPTYKLPLKDTSLETNKRSFKETTPSTVNSDNVPTVVIFGWEVVASVPVISLVTYKLPLNDASPDKNKLPFTDKSSETIKS